MDLCGAAAAVGISRLLSSPMSPAVKQIRKMSSRGETTGCESMSCSPSGDVEEVEGISPRDDSAPVAVKRLYHSASCVSIGALCRLIPGHKRQLAHSQPIINSVCTPGRHAHMAECKHPDSAPVMESAGASLSMEINRDAAAKITPNRWSFPLLRP